MQVTSNITIWPIKSADPTSVRELKPILDLISSQLQRATSFTTFAFFGLHANEWSRLDFRGPQHTDSLEKIHLSSILILLGTPSQLETPVFIDDLLKIPRFAEVEEFQKLISEVDKYARNWMLIPLVFNGKVVGLLSFTKSEPAYFTSRHAKLALLIFEQAFQAHSRLAVRAQTAAILEERQRMARELHDSVTQVFYGIELAASTADVLMDRNDFEKVRKQLAEIVTLAEAGLTEMRALLFELRPESLQIEGLVAALVKQTDALRIRHELKVTTTLCPEPDVPIEYKEALYRIAQESFQNIIKHAHAHEVSVKLNFDDTGIGLEICDDGRGFDTNANYPGHIGLSTMYERINLLGGTINIYSKPKTGTCITVKIPVTP